MAMKNHPPSKTLTPKLRFPEFKDGAGWELRSLASVLDYERPERYIVADTAYLSSGTPVLTANKSFVLGHTNEAHGVFDDLPVIIFDDFTTDRKYVDFPFKVKSSAIKILKRRGDDELKLIFELMGGIRFDPKEHKRYYISEYQHLEIPLPREAEQRTVAACLTSLDELLAAEGQKLEVLAAHKKGLMQQLFPREGEPRPRLRFPEFRDKREWERHPLGKLCRFVRGPFGGALKKDIFVPEGYAVYEQSHAIDNQMRHFRYFITKEKYEEMKRFAVQPNDLIMSCSGTMGKFAQLPENPVPGVINQALLKLTVQKGWNSQFLLLLLGLPATQSKLLTQSAGGAMKNVVGVPQLKAIELPMPREAEQQRIAACLSSLDALIAAQSRKLDGLRAHKKGLMQQLFPSPEGV